jgi:hypothetical protein
MEPIEIDERDRAKLTFVSILTFFGLFAMLIVLWNLFDTGEETTAMDRLSSRCREDAGVIIEGVNETDNGATNHFAICVPYEALTCIDVE